jgi:hypothetical protein
MKIIGTIIDETHKPLAGCAVVAYHGDVDLPKEKVLRRGKTGRAGRYSLSVDLARYPRGANIRVAVLGKRSRELWSSAIHHNAKSDLAINAEIPTRVLDTTEYRRLADRIESRVRLGTLSQLNPTQRSYLACSTGVADADLAMLASASQLHDALPALTTETFFGLLKQRLPAGLDALVALDETSWRDALAVSMNDNVIKRLSARTIGKIVAVLAARNASVASPGGTGAAALAAVAIPSNAKRKRIASVAARHDGVNGPFWKALRRSPGVTAKDVARLKDAADVHNVLGQDPELLEAVAAHLRRRGKEVTPPALATIDRSAWPTLVKDAARKRRADAPKRDGAGQQRAPIAETAGAIAAQVAWRFPTQALAAEINSASSKGYFGRHKKGLSNFFKRNREFDIRAGLAELLPPGPVSDRPATEADTVKQRVKTAARLYRTLPEAHAPADSDAAVASAGIFQRLSALADSKHQYRSSFDISRRPRASFAKELARNEGEVAYWEGVHDQATATSDVARFMVVSLLQRGRMSTNVTKGFLSAEDEEVREQPGVADLRSLFGSLDRCQCEQCTSVTSPASYFADTLNFLQIDVAASGAESPYKVLIERRPDIPHILLNCDNTSVELPYIDVVNELLEDEVLRQKKRETVWSPYHNVTLDVSPADLDKAALRNPPQATEAKRAIASALNAVLPGYDFDGDLQVSVRRWREDRSSDHWFVFNKGWLVELADDASPVVSDGTGYTLETGRNVNRLARKRGAGGDSYQISVKYISRQTYGTSEELEANPLFRNAEVAEILEGAEFPPGMPPGLPLREARLFLEHLKLPREQLIRQLTPATVDVWAVEYLGLSAADADQLGKVGGATSWGFAGPMVKAEDALVDPANSTQLLTGDWTGSLQGAIWVGLLRRVDILIARARISYIDLLELLSTESVNPTLRSGQRATIVSIDDPATCDLSKLHIQLSGDDFKNVLERMRRFLRLQRRIGWKTWELDLALRQLKIDLLSLRNVPDRPNSPGSSVATQIVPLAILKRVKAALRLGHADACALLGKIDLARGIDFRSDGQPTLPSQYEALLLNRAVTNPVDSRLLLDDAHNALQKAPAAEDGLATLGAAFQVDASDIALILKWLADPLNPKRINVKPRDPLTLDLISQIYKRALFARGFGISVQELIWIERLNGGLPSVDDCPAFIDRVALLRRSSLSVTEAWHLLADADVSTAYLVPGDDEIAHQLDEIRQQLVTIDADHLVPGPTDTDGAQLRRILGELDFGEPLIDDLLGVVTDTKLFSVDVTLPASVVRQLDPAAGAAFTPPANTGFLRKDDVVPLVRYSKGGVLFALHPLTRSDRATLLRSTTNAPFRNAVETLHALGKLSYEGKRLTCRGLLPSLGAVAVERHVKTTVEQGVVLKRALDAIVFQQTQLLTRKLQHSALAQYEFPLQSARPLSIPAQLQPYFHLDQVRNVLVVRGRPTDLELETLRTSSAIPASILNLLRSGQLPAMVNAVPAFLALADIPTIFDPTIAPAMPTTTADISLELLETRGLTTSASDALKHKAIAAALGGAFGLTDGITQYLLRTLPSAAGQAATIADAFASLSTPGARIDLAPYRSDYRRLSKVALLLQRLKIQEVHLPWLFDYLAADWLSVPSLEVGAATGGADLANLTELVRLIAIASRSPYSPQLVARVLALAVPTRSAVFTDVLKLLVENSSWTATDLQTICKSLGIASPAAFLKAQTFERLRDAMNDLTRLGATAEQALQLAAREIDDPAAVVAKSLAKSKHTPADWLKVVEPINNILRESRRSALVDYLVTHPRRDQKTPLWHDVDTLYEHLLVDVQMGACMKTTRIRLALSAVQLFVQRCLMNLEAPDVSIGDDSPIRRRWNEWESWRKLYRIWEAQRRIFLHPEDWMEPGLRDDKTPFFKELEDELLQADVTNDTAEAAILNYLRKLDQVSKLEVMGFFIDHVWSGALPSVAADPSDGPEFGQHLLRTVLHVVARTYGEPHEWFYRTLTTTTPQPWHEGAWSPWERIDADVEGDHVLPVVWNRHVYLFWALFDQKGERPTSKELNDKQQTHDSHDRWYVRVAWSELTNGKWSPKRVSKGALKTPVVETGDRPITEADFSFKTDVTGGGIHIKCYGPHVPEPTNTRPVHDPPPNTKGQKIYSGTAWASIEFWDANNNDRYLAGVDASVYLADGSEDILFKLRSGASGRVALSHPPAGTALPQDWSPSTDIDVYIPSVFKVVRDGNLAWNANDPGHRRFISLSKQTVVNTVDTRSVTLPGGFSSQQGRTDMSRIGRFDYEGCSGELRPSVGALGERIPPLQIGESTQSTTLRAMVYLEIGADDESQAYVPSQPFLKGVLGTTPGTRYRVLLPHQTLFPDTMQPFFFQDGARAYFVVLPQNPVPLTVDEIEQAKTLVADSGAGAFSEGPAFRRHRFELFYHPWVCDFIARVNMKGVDELLTLRSQAQDDVGATFLNVYRPDITRVQFLKRDQEGALVPVTREDVDFDRRGAYSIYNWELFFHIPWLVATRLQANQRFEEARAWFHYIFDPTSRPGADAPATPLEPTQRFWNVLPFWKAQGQTIRSIDDLLGATDSSEAFRKWREEPFKPFVVGRARQSAFMQSVVMSYIDNLIEWGDYQFARFTAESTNEATLLYVLASQILGRAPEKIPPRVRPTLQTYQSLEEYAAGATSPAPTWQNFSDVMVEIETFIPPSAAIAEPETSSPLGRMWAFCVPPNDKLLQAWPRVAQRLFNLRHCRDIEGVARAFPIWDPEIDPGLLVRAAAAGVDLASVLGDINAATPHYRFNVMVRLAIDLCSEVKSFGAALLSALQNHDAEGLSLLRARQDVALSNKVKEVRQRQVEQSKAQREAAERSKASAEARRDHYEGLQFRNAGEAAAQVLAGAAIFQETVAGVSEALGAAAALLPQFGYGTSGTYSSPVAIQTIGGEQFSRAASATAAAARASGAILSMTAAGALTQAGYDRRNEEWNLQITLAKKDLDQIEKQIVAAEIQEDIAQKERDNQQRQTDNAQAVTDHLTGKYTNQQLFGWMQGQLSSLHFQAYKLAFQVARKAERAFRHELGVPDAGFIQFGYWDSLKKGLLAGERLQSDLRRMEAAYLDQNVREFEITKHVSLTALNPAALILLKATGRCEVEIPEWLFDMDYSRHCMRRIKSLALSIPCVAGPYTSVNCTLTQLSSKVRLADGGAADYNSPSNFHEYFGSAEAIVTSSGREDSGLFEVNFRDERYLPFEGTGAISRWRIELPLESNQFDLWTVSDVIFHFRYTARSGGGDRPAAATAGITGSRLFSLKHEFPSEWSQMTTVRSAAAPAWSEVSLSKDRFPFFFTTKGRTLSIKGVSLYALPSDSTSDLTFPDSLKLVLAPRPAGNASDKRPSVLDKASDTSIGRLSGKRFDPNVDFQSAEDKATWTFEVSSPVSFKKTVADVLIVCEYELSTE